MKLSTLFTQLMTVAAAILVFLAHNWDTLGIGINPWLALPLATLCMLLPYVFDHFYIEIIPEDDLSFVRLKNRKENNTSIPPIHNHNDGNNH